MGLIFWGIKVDANVHVNREGFPLYYKWVVVSFLFLFLPLRTCGNDAI